MPRPGGAKGGNRGGGKKKPPPFTAEELFGAVSDKEIDRIWTDMERELALLSDAIAADLDLVRDGTPIEIELEMVVRLCALLRRWMKPVDAAVCAGWTAESFTRWMNEGKKPGSRPVYKAFFRVVRKARAEGKMRGLAMANLMAANGNLAALRWGMGTAYPDDYGPNADKAKVEDITQVPGYEDLFRGVAEIMLRHLEPEKAAAAVTDFHRLAARLRGSQEPARDEPAE